MDEIGLVAVRPPVRARGWEEAHGADDLLDSAASISIAIVSIVSITTTTTSAAPVQQRKALSKPRQSFHRHARAVALAPVRATATTTATSATTAATAATVGAITATSTAAAATPRSRKQCVQCRLEVQCGLSDSSEHQPGLLR